MSPGESESPLLFYTSAGTFFETAYKQLLTTNFSISRDTVLYLRGKFYFRSRDEKNYQTMRFSYEYKCKVTKEENEEKKKELISNQSYFQRIERVIIV